MRKKNRQDKELSNTFRPDKEPGKIGGMVELEPAPWVDSRQRPYFDEIARHLNENEVAAKIDGYVVSLTALWLWVFDDTARQLRESGPIQVYPTGATAVHPNATLLKTASNILGGLFKSLGMSPDARERLSSFQVEGDPDGFDPLAELLN